MEEISDAIITCFLLQQSTASGEDGHLHSEQPWCLGSEETHGSFFKDNKVVIKMLY